MTKTPEKIAFIGLGKIGLPSARLLLAADHEVIGYRRSPCPEFIAAGGVMASDAAKAVSECEIVIQCLPDATALEAVAFGEKGVLSAVRPGQTVIELSSYSLEEKTRYRDALAKQGANLIEVEVSGTPDMMARGEATLFVGSGQANSEDVLRILGRLSKRVIEVGGFGAAFGMKLVANFMVASHTAIAAEALVLAQALGLDPARVVEVISQSPATSAMFQIRGPWMVEGNYTPAPGPINMIEKYLTWIASAATDAGIELPTFSATRSLYDEAIAQGLGEKDIAAVKLLIEK